MNSVTLNAMSCLLPRIPLLLVLCSLAVCSVGCGPQRAAPVDVEVARSTLIEVLNTWQQGGTIQELRNRQPTIVVQEVLWEEQATLVSYQLVGEGRKEDANWFCDVELVIQNNSNGSKRTHNVTYAVGTDPVLTVFHAML